MAARSTWPGEFSLVRGERNVLKMKNSATRAPNSCWTRYDCIDEVNRRWVLDVRERLCTRCYVVRLDGSPVATLRTRYPFSSGDGCFRDSRLCLKNNRFESEQGVVEVSQKRTWFSSEAFVSTLGHVEPSLLIASLIIAVYWAVKAEVV